MRSRVFALACACLAASGLGGCAVFAGKAAQPPLARQSQQRLYRLSAWTLEGRIGAKTAQEGWSASLFWEHDEGQDRLRVSGPFNQGAVSIIVQSDLIYVNEGNGVASFSRNPDAWLKQRLGFAVPLRSLRYWILGLPDPNAEYTSRLNAEGGLAGFEQQEWVLAFESFESVGDLALPKKMSLRGGEVTLKLIADEWVVKQ